MAYSDFWLGPNWNLPLRRQRTDHETAYRLASLLRGVKDFVSIITKKNIPVQFSSGQQSYTDGKTVVISSNDASDAIDVTVGLALHESAHIVLSADVFQLYSMIAETLSPTSTGAYVTASTRKNYDTWAAKLNALVGTNAFPTKEALWDHVRLIINVLEDRRIDAWMYKKIGGYRPYYDALYDRYFHSEYMKDLLANNMKYQLPTLEAYETHIIALPSRHRNEAALPGLKDIYSLVDLKNPEKLDDIKYVMQQTLEIAKIVAKHVTTPTALEKAAGDESNEEFEGRWPNQGNLNNGLPNLDDAKALVKGKPTDRKSITEAMSENVDAIAQGKARIGHTDSHEDDVTTKKTKGYHNEMLQKRPYLVFDRVTSGVVSSNLYPYKTTRGTYASYVKRGIQLGNLLANKLAVLHDERTLVSPRQKAGKLDKRRVSSLGFNDPSVFKTTVTEKSKPVFVHLTIDASGSMSGKPFGESLLLAAALARVAELNRAFRLQISLRSTESYNVVVAIIYDSAVDRTRKFHSVLKTIGVGGGTPEGLAFNAIKRTLGVVPAGTRKYFVNISDGMPEGGEQGVTYTKVEVDRLVRYGTTVLAYYVSSYDVYEGGSADAFRTMYGKSAQFIDPANINDIARTLNKMFLE